MNGGVYYPALTGQISGNTAGATALISSGTFVLAGGNNITLSQNANSVTISAGAGGGGFLAGMSTQGNTAGTTGLASQQLALVGANNITLSGSTNAGSMTISLSGVAAQTVQSAIRAFGISNTGQTAGNTGLSTGIDWVLAGSNSITLSQSTAAGGPNTVWFQHPAWLTTARGSTDAIGLNTAQTNVTWTVNSSGLSLNAGGYAGTVSGATNATITANTAGVSVSVAAPFSAGVSTGGNTSGDTGLVAGRLVFVGNNNITLSGSTNGGSMTITVSGATVAGQPVNFSAGTTSNNLGSVVFSDSNGVSFGLNGSTITATVSTYSTVGTATTVYPVASANSVGTVTRWAAEDHRHGPVAISTYEPYRPQGLSTVFVGVPTATSAAVSIYPFWVDDFVSAGCMNLAASMSFVTVGTSSGRQTAGLALGLYTLNDSTLSSLASTSWSWQVTGNNSSYTINQVTTTNYTGFGATGATNSAGVSISSGYTGMKLIAVPVNTLMTPGQYFLGVIGTNSTSSINVGISLSLMGAAMATGLSAMAPMGSFSSAFTSGQNPFGGRFNRGQGSWTSAGSVTMLPASMNMASVSAVGLTYPLIRFWST